MTVIVQCFNEQIEHTVSWTIIERATEMFTPCLGYKPLPCNPSLIEFGPEVMELWKIKPSSTVELE